MELPPTAIRITRDRKSVMRKEIWEQQTGERDHIKPVWKQPRGSYGNNFWQMYSWKLDRDVHFYSNLERDHGVIMEADPNVAWFCEQPLRINIKLDGRDHKTVIDMLVHFSNGRKEYREVKYVRDLQRVEDHSRVARQLAAQQDWAIVTANEYKIVTEHEIRRNAVFIRNWKQILAYLATYASYDLAEIEDQILAAFDDGHSWSLGCLQRHMSPLKPQTVTAAIFRLIHGGLCTAPLDVCPLTSSLIIQRGTK